MQAAAAEAAASPVVFDGGPQQRGPAAPNPASQQHLRNDNAGQQPSHPVPPKRGTVPAADPPVYVPNAMLPVYRAGQAPAALHVGALLGPARLTALPNCRGGEAWVEEQRDGLSGEGPEEEQMDWSWRRSGDVWEGAQRDRSRRCRGGVLEGEQREERQLTVGDRAEAHGNEQAAQDKVGALRVPGPWRFERTGKVATIPAAFVLPQGRWSSSDLSASHGSTRANQAQRLGHHSCDQNKAISATRCAPSCTHVSPAVVARAAGVGGRPQGQAATRGTMGVRGARHR